MRPKRLAIPELNEEVVVNDRSVFRIEPSRNVALFDPERNKFAFHISQDPLGFSDRSSFRACAELKGLVDALYREESAIAQEVLARPTQGRIRALLEPSIEAYRRLVDNFGAGLESILGETPDDSTVAWDLQTGVTLATISPDYRLLFGQGRWFEVIIYFLVRLGLDSPTTAELIPDPLVLGRSGLKHEVDVLLVAEDLAVVLEATAGGWGRKDVIQLVAQREDISTDMGILVTTRSPPEDFEPLSKAHPIVIFPELSERAAEFVAFIRDQTAKVTRTHPRGS